MSVSVSQRGTQGASKVSILRVDAGGPRAVEDKVAVEEPLEIQLSYAKRGIRVVKSVSVTMRTPGSDRELAAGFLHTEGIVSNASAFESWESPATNVLRAVLREDIEVDLRSMERNFYMTSSCGVCGKTSLEALRVTGRISLDPARPLWDGARITSLPATLRADQLVFEETGGLHAAGLFAADGSLITTREDVGRHNAVDKLVGSQLLEGHRDLGGCLLMVSGRASFELVQKAVMAGIPVLAAVGAPSSLAVDLARQFGATLLGFVGNGRFNIYSGAQRVVLLADPAS
ncbi:MAG TPA: formate dehydrogenase accessory sulfurtransferase FdhD [Opitutaceae bacterium]|nr:formate dehydrogenase accessory sulfurtransferase FdhD [Opitutaceae bacterium]